MTTAHPTILALGVASGLALAACSGDEPSGPPPPPDGGSGTITTFSPEGCGFSIAARPEYVDFARGSTVVGATPEIRRVRLGLGGNVAVGAEGRADPATSIGVAWQTNEGTLASDITWGPTPDATKWPATNRASGVTWKTPEGTINASGDERMHEAYVCGLAPATTYYYRVGGGPAGGEAWSEVHAFTTTPAAGSGKVVLGVSGDSRGQNNDAWHLIQRRFLAKGVTLQLFSGDMTNFATDQGEWEKWLDVAWKDDDGSLLTSGQLLMLAAHGNHEAHSSLFFGNVVAPQDVAKYPQWGELFYSVDVGPVHVVVIDDAFIVSPDQDPAFQAPFEAWLRADLEAADKRRAQVPWIVTMHHHASFSSSNHGDESDVLLGRAFFVPIWDEYHVDLALAGHDHDYERSKPLTGPADTPTVHTDFADGTVYVVSGGAGADAYGAGTSAWTELSRDFKSGGAIGYYSYVTFDGSSCSFESHELRPDGTDPAIDTFTITK